MGFPSDADALKILCLSAFRQTSPPDAVNLHECEMVVKYCGSLPLKLHVFGSGLRGRSDDHCNLFLLGFLWRSLSEKSQTLLQYFLECSYLETFKETGHISGCYPSGHLTKILADLAEEIDDDDLDMELVSLLFERLGTLGESLFLIYYA